MRMIEKGCLCSCLVAFMATTGFGQTVFFVELDSGAALTHVNGNSETVFMVEGQTISLGMYFSDGVTNTPVQGFQGSFPCNATQLGGAVGAVDFDAGTMQIDTGRADYIYLGVNGVFTGLAQGDCAVDPDNNPQTVGAILGDPGPIFPASPAKYFGHMEITASGTSPGEEYELEIVCVFNDACPQGEETFFRDENSSGEFFENLAKDSVIIQIIEICTSPADCNDGNECTNDSCDPGGPGAGPDGCVNDAAGADGQACGSANDDACDNPDTCLAGVCEDNLESAGTACTPAGDPECNDGACDGAGTCDTTAVADGTGCSEFDGNVCTIEQCSGGVCTPNAGAADGDACGSSGDTECDNPDSCLAGNCEPNFESNGFGCGSGLNDDCTNPDTCNGAGTCLANDEGSGTSCGSGLDDECTNPDTCDGAGTCDANDESAGTGCTPVGDPECNDGACDGTGTCDTTALGAGTSCGDGADTDCTDPDSCDGSGSCLANDESSGTACGSNLNNDCANPDTCDGSGTCDSNDESPGTACGSFPGDPECNSGECDGGVNCVDVNDPNGQACSDDGNECTDDECLAGVCDHPNSATGTACTPDDVGCSEDICDGGACTHPLIGGTPCNPAGGDACAALGGTCDPPDDLCVCIESPTLCLDAVPDTGPATPNDDCFGFGDQIVVEINMGASGNAVCGGQFFLEYDISTLEFKEIIPGGDPFTTVFFEFVDTDAGTIDYAIGSNPNLPCNGTNGPFTIASIVFNAVGDCKSTGVCFREHNPPTILAGENGQAVCPEGHQDPKTGECLEDPPDPCCTGQLSIDHESPSINCPGGTEGNPDCDGVTLPFTWDEIVAVDNCDGDIDLDCTIMHDGGADVSGLLDGGGDFPIGITSIWCTGADSCGNVVECHFDVVNSGLNNVVIDIELSPTMANVNLVRGIDLHLSDCDAAGEAEVFDTCADVEFGPPFFNAGHGSVQLKVPAHNWVCIEATDPRHTLTATCTLLCEDVEGVSAWHATFKGTPDLSECHWLVNGNVFEDEHIDILDYGVYIANLGGPVDPNTLCGDTEDHADINGDGVVNVFDFSFILLNFFDTAKAPCDEVCGVGATGPRNEGPLASITARELLDMGYTAAQVDQMDRDDNGIIDVTDMAMYLNDPSDEEVHEAPAFGASSSEAPGRGMR